MTPRILLITACAIVYAAGAMADVIQSDGSTCGELDSPDLSCNNRLPFIWPNSYNRQAFFSTNSQENTAYFTFDPGTPIVDYSGGTVGTLTAAIRDPLPTGNNTLAAEDRNGFDLVYNLTAGGTTYRIDQPLEFAFATSLERFSGGKTSPGSDSLSDVIPPRFDSDALVIYPRFDRPWATNLPEQTTWSEMLTFMLSGAALIGLRNRMIPR